METLQSKRGEERKCVLYFRNGGKCLPLNRVNFDSCAAICGEDTDDWPGSRVELFPSRTDLRGEQVDCIRIRRPGQTDLEPTKPTKPAGKPKAKPPSDDGGDDMDDEIPF
jgi:hypothetical protein